MPQGRRNRVLQGLRSRQLRILVATDVAARGIDVRTISHVVNYGLPMKPEDYVHRIGRTGRAGRNGLAVTLAERMDAGMIRRIQQFTTQPIPVTTIGGLEPKIAAPKVYAERAGCARRRPDRSHARRGAASRGGWAHRGPMSPRGNPVRPGPASCAASGVHRVRGRRLQGPRQAAGASAPGGFAR